MKRENGFYWVLDFGTWIIAEWIGAGIEGGWVLTQNKECYQDDRFEHINENRLQCVPFSLLGTNCAQERGGWCDCGVNCKRL